MKAIGKNIVVLPVKETETKTKGGLLLAEAHREDIRYRMAKVVTIGDAVVGVKDNDTIYYDRHAGFGIEIKNEKLSEIHFHQFTGLPEGVTYRDGSDVEEGVAASSGVHVKRQFTFTSDGVVETINADDFILKTLQSFQESDALGANIQSVDSLNVFMPGENSPLVKTPTVEKDTKTKKTILQSGAEFLQTGTTKGLALGVGTAAALYWLFQKEGAAETFGEYVPNGFMQGLQDLINRLGIDSAPAFIQEQINTFFSSADLKKISPQDTSVIHWFADNGNSLPALLSLVGQTMKERVSQNTSNFSLPSLGNGSFNSTRFQITPIFKNFTPLTVSPADFIRGVGSLVLPNMPSALYSVSRSVNDSSVTPSHSSVSGVNPHAGHPSSGSGVSTQTVGEMPVSDGDVTLKRQNTNYFLQLNASDSVGQSQDVLPTPHNNLPPSSVGEQGTTSAPQGELLLHGHKSPQAINSSSLSSGNLGGGSNSSGISNHTDQDSHPVILTQSPEAFDVAHAYTEITQENTQAQNVEISVQLCGRSKVEETRLTLANRSEQKNSTAIAGADICSQHSLEAVSQAKKLTVPLNPNSNWHDLSWECFPVSGGNSVGSDSWSLMDHTQPRALPFIDDLSFQPHEVYTRSVRICFGDLRNSSELAPIPFTGEGSQRIMGASTPSYPYNPSLVPSLPHSFSPYHGKGPACIETRDLISPNSQPFYLTDIHRFFVNAVPGSNYFGFRY